MKKEKRLEASLDELILLFEPYDIDIAELENLKLWMNLPLYISVIAEVSRGKSTFLNALLFKELMLECRNGETTANVFMIGYEKHFDHKAQREYIKKINCNSIEDIDNLEDVGIVINSNNSKYTKDIFCDTPGFNTSNEDHMQTMINEFLPISSCVIFIIDISKGITKEELKQLKNVKEQGVEDVIIVANKFDMVRDEFQNEKDIDFHLKKIEQEISKVISLNNPIFYVASKEALAGYITKNKEKIANSRFPIFETFFVHQLKKIREKKVEDISRVVMLYNDENMKNKLEIDVLKTHLDLVKKQEYLPTIESLENIVTTMLSFAEERDYISFVNFFGGLDSDAKGYVTTLKKYNNQISEALEKCLTFFYSIIQLEIERDNLLSKVDNTNIMDKLCLNEVEEIASIQGYITLKDNFFTAINDVSIASIDLTSPLISLGTELSIIDVKDISIFGETENLQKEYKLVHNKIKKLKSSIIGAKHVFN
ncbi:dynamin family protein [Sulfurimonas sp. SAG-AH-194-C21]|nr:dynamin family protein [Sulfurimonas sp. SAG-AH-194-C21]MDF1882618.1 dynamin family protein [Sulfurimonas sp. SAG-AH-194-C21]